MPSIGIVTYPLPSGQSYIHKPLADWFETNGVRVVPIPYHTTDHELYFHNVNGLCIPGNLKGETEIHPAYFHTLKRFYELSLQKKEYFPIWGECNGFQLLMFITGHFRALKEYDVTNYIPIKPIASSRLLRSFPSSYLHFLEHGASTFHDHYHGISLDDFMKNKDLTHFYTICATSVDKKGKEFVALIEAKDHPIYGSAFHPYNMKRNKPIIQFIRSELIKNKHASSVPFLHTIHRSQKYKIGPSHYKDYYLFS